MEQEKIKELLSRFYEGLTSDEEEAALREHFSGNPPEEDIGMRLLLAYRNEAVPEPSEGFSGRLADIPAKAKAPGSSRRIVMYAVSAAAGLALLIGSYFTFRTVTANRMTDTFQDPELAMAEVREILLIVSHNMNKGTEPLNSISTLGIVPESLKSLDKLNSAADNNLGKLRYLNDFDMPEEEKENKK